ncbi:hypothetical protein KIPB_010746 [Kipferlia bialata]|uniref:SET domain-containing protein n=1 Tax=Kipferlia bialata TaxID=797122 RepID=A0A9K3D515_9EUKA|nr:hypothetical protein KIPB_010746 [Kipferlia bialata]|eukprot:g10746.t1
MAPRSARVSTPQRSVTPDTSRLRQMTLDEFQVVKPKRKSRGPGGYKKVKGLQYKPKGDREYSIDLPDIEKPSICKRSDKYSDCQCNPDYPCDPDSQCYNVVCNVECRKTCPAGAACRNRRFQKREYADLEVKDAEGKGKGLFAASDIECGAFIIEYVGDVISKDLMLERLLSYNKEFKHNYIMDFGSGHYIDATKTGNIARFANHSCGPNAETQKWEVGAENRVGLFALRDIEEGEEIVFDYQFEWIGEEAPPKCMCGADECRGFLGAKKKSKAELRAEAEEREREAERERAKKAKKKPAKKKPAKASKSSKKTSKK